MSVEKYINENGTFLNATINNSVTSLVVTSGTWPTTGSFRIKIDGEIMLVTAVSTLTFTVTRGVEGTTAASHNAGTIIYPVMTDQSLRNLVRQSIDGAETTIRREMNFKQDGGVYCSITDDGTNDKADIVFSSGGLGKAFVKPVSGNFTWRNQGSASIAQSGSGLYMTAPAQAATENNRIQEITPGAAPWSIVGYLAPAVLSKAKLSAGFAFILNSSGAMHRVAVGEGKIYVDKYSAPGTFSADYLNPISSLHAGAPFNWFKLQDDNTNRLISVSVDGTNWILLHSITRTDFITADRVGWFVNANNTGTPNYDAGAMLMSWKLN